MQLCILLHSQCKLFHSHPYLSEFFVNLYFTHLLVVSSSTMLMAFSSHFHLSPTLLASLWITLHLRASPCPPIARSTVYHFLHTLQQSPQSFNTLLLSPIVYRWISSCNSTWCYQNFSHCLSFVYEQSNSLLFLFCLKSTNKNLLWYHLM